MDKNGKIKYIKLGCLFLCGLFLIYIKKLFDNNYNICGKTCSNMKNDFDVLKCLDACSVNKFDYSYSEPIPTTKFFLFGTIILSLFVMAISFTNKFINNDKNFLEKLLNFINKLKEIKNSIFGINKYENQYQKLKQNE